ncbi:MAG: hypothetical protein ACKVT1_18590, partial [Dehalococcoidia bacterium]
CNGPELNQGLESPDNVAIGGYPPDYSEAIGDPDSAPGGSTLFDLTPGEGAVAELGPAFHGIPDGPGAFDDAVGDPHRDNDFSDGGDLDV